MPAVHEPTSWGAGATGAPNDMVDLKWGILILLV